MLFYVVICYYMLLYVIYYYMWLCATICYYMLLGAIIWCYMLLYVIECYYMLLYVIICYYIWLYVKNHHFGIPKSPFSGSIKPMDFLRKTSRNPKEIHRFWRLHFGTPKGPKTIEKLMVFQWFLDLVRIRFGLEFIRIY